jgi:hypothetical protein
MNAHVLLDSALLPEDLMLEDPILVDPGKSLRTPTAIRKYTFPALTRVSPIGGLPGVARPQQSAAAA